MKFPERKAAQTILDAGCGGTATLTWLIDYALNGEPHYAPGDASWEDPYGNEKLWNAVRVALEAMSKGDIEEPSIIKKRRVKRVEP